MTRLDIPILRFSAPLETIFLGLWLALAAAPASAGPVDWINEFPLTDIAKRSINLTEIRSDGATRDSIPPINDPKFVPISQVRGVGDLEPVISLTIGRDSRAYPLRILLWHEIVNDVVGGIPVLITYCPLCNSGVVFDRRVAGRTLSFGNTGRLRHFDMIMYDHETESWWQQFLGEAIIGDMTGQRLDAIPARVESLEKFRTRIPEGKLLVPDDAKARPYGTTPYLRMDTQAAELPYDLPDGVRSFERVVVVGTEAWTLKYLKQQGSIEKDGLVLTWLPGQNSIHDTKWISFGRDIGNVSVFRRTDKGLEDVAYDVAFAFAFAAFVPDGRLYTQ